MKTTGRENGSLGRDREKNSHGKSLKIRTTPDVGKETATHPSLPLNRSSPVSGSSWVGAFGNYNWEKPYAV